MIGSSGRQRVHEKYLEQYKLPKIDSKKYLIFTNQHCQFMNSKIKIFIKPKANGIESVVALEVGKCLNYDFYD